MQVGKLIGPEGSPRVGIVADDRVRLLPPIAVLAEYLAGDDPQAMFAAAASAESVPLAGARWLAPIDRQEVWAAGVTYKRSQQARMEESEQAASFYDKVYSAERPELFFKATPHRVVGLGDSVRIRGDTRWSVPEPELALVLTPKLRLVGYTAGNDMSARDIEGENPLYLPQAKVYDQCCGLGPVITLASELPPAEEMTIELHIDRDGREVFRGATTIAAMNRTPADLVNWLGRDNSFPDGVVLLTGTGVVPPDDFSLRAGDVVHIDLAGVGRLTNRVVQGS